MVVVDCQGFPMKYDQMGVMESVVARQVCRIQVDVPRGGGGWRRTNGVIDTQDDPDLNDEWRRDLANGARYMLQETLVKHGEPHYDAKVWPICHPLRHR